MNKSILKDRFYKPILNAPNLKAIIDELQEFWQDEQNRRLDFYNWVTPDMKAEFIEGEIIVHSPVRKSHGDCGENLFMILKLFIRQKDLGWVGYEKYMTRFTRNDYEPDISFIQKPKSDYIKNDQTIFPVPDFIVEILSKSTEERDRGIKKLDYQQHGVKEYWIIDADTQFIEQYILNDEGEYTDANIYTVKDTIPCYVINGLNIPLSAIFHADNNHAFIQQMMMS